MELNKLNVINAVNGYKNNQFTAREMVEDCIKRCEEIKGKNAVIEVFSDALELARLLDEKKEKGLPLGKLAGVTVMIKDNILFEGKKATACSKFMQNFVSTYTATALQKMIEEDAIVIGRTNMDEFCMGSDGESSVYGASKNAFGDERIAGGSSGGSAVAVALDACTVALGSDTGGSARKPASYNGVVAVKPFYGTVSRHGLYSLASSLDQIAPICKNVSDTAYVLSIISGTDEMDMSSTKESCIDYCFDERENLNGVTVAVEKSVVELIKGKECEKPFLSLVENLKRAGAEIKEIEIENLCYVKDVYDLISVSEASSNFARFDGIKYTTRTENPVSANELYKKSRSEGFNEKVKLNIMLGNYVLSSGKAYQTAKNLQQLIINNTKKALEGVDLLIMPTVFSEAPIKGETADREESILTVFANIVKAYAINVPFATGENKLPLGVQVCALENKYKNLFITANFIEKNYKGGRN